jgi:hypothetical protein
VGETEALGLNCWDSHISSECVRSTHRCLASCYVIWGLPDEPRGTVLQPACLSSAWDAPCWPTTMVMVEVKPALPWEPLTVRQGQCQGNGHTASGPTLSITGGSQDHLFRTPTGGPTHTLPPSIPHSVVTVQSSHGLRLFPCPAPYSKLVLLHFGAFPRCGV